MTQITIDSQGRKWWTNNSTLKESEDRAFDLEFWQSQSDEAILHATAEMPEVLVSIGKLPENAMRMDRTIESFQRL